MGQFLSYCNTSSNSTVQLAGVAAIVIAAKKEESNAPKLDEVGRYTAGSCTDTAIRDQELHMLEVNGEQTKICEDLLFCFDKRQLHQFYVCTQSV